MSAVPASISSGKKPRSQLEMVRIFDVSKVNPHVLAEDAAMIQFLQRGWKIQTPGYYSVCDFVYGRGEKSLTFCCDVELNRYRPPKIADKETYSAYDYYEENFPRFKVLFDQNLVIVQNELFGNPRNMAKLYGIPTDICNLVLTWLYDWGHHGALVKDRVQIISLYEILHITKLSRLDRDRKRKQNGEPPLIDSFEEVGKALANARNSSLPQP